MEKNTVSGFMYSCTFESEKYGVRLQNWGKSSDLHLHTLFLKVRGTAMGQTGGQT